MKTLAKIHCLKKDLRLDDDTYRAMLRAQTGKESAKDLSASQQLKVISYMVACQNNAPNLAGAGTKTLLETIRTILGRQGKCRAYAEEIAKRMHEKRLIKCDAPELLQVIDALNKVA